MGRESLLPAQVFDVRLPDGDELHRVRHEPLSGRSVQSVFEFLFKYRPFVFEKGHLGFSPPWSTYGLAVFGLGVLGFLTFSYTRVRGKSGWRDRTILATVRAAALAVILFCLLRPKLVLSTVIPQRNFLGILIDDSQSMRIADRAGAPRSSFVAQAFGT